MRDSSGVLVFGTVIGVIALAALTQPKAPSSSAEETFGKGGVVKSFTEGSTVFTDFADGSQSVISVDPLVTFMLGSDRTLKVLFGTEADAKRIIESWT